MSYRSLQECLRDLQEHGHLLRIAEPVDPHLEAAEIHRRVYQAGGPAVLYENVVGCKFPMVSNLLGTMERARFVFRDSIEAVRRLVELKIDPNEFWRRPLRYRGVPRAALTTLPKKCRRGPVLANETMIDRLPHQVSWPDDGGPFITLPQVYSEDVRRPGLKGSNLGMYRVQLSGNEYETNKEVGLHYQIHRSIGVHHAAAREAGVPFRANIFVGGPPAMFLAAVMPLPEGLSELMFAGALAGRRIRMINRGDGLPVHADADFCITGTVSDELKPEGPFGDHLGYYAKGHPFPVLRVEKVYHRDGAIWPFTVVGRPPQEDTVYGQLIHELTGPIIPTVLPGVHAVHAVDAAGVHPLLLAIGSERYTPYQELLQPQELLTQANAILGQGQLSLAKYLWIVAHQDAPDLDIHDIPAFFRHVLSRVDWRRDLHFQTRTTIDTLDYSGSGLNEGSKVVIAAAGPVRRELPTEMRLGFELPTAWQNAKICMPGVLAIEVSPDVPIQRQCEAIARDHPVNTFPLIVAVDDAEFTARSLENFLWVTFTRSNPAADIHGIAASVDQKHWGCAGPLVIDARTKPHHAPPLIEDPKVTEKVNRLAARGGPLNGII